MTVNKAILIGHLGADPETRYTQAGQAVCSFRVATSESWTDKNGQKQDQTEWHSIVVWGKLAELCQQYLKKGRQAYVEGKIKTRQWQDKDGQTRYTTEIVADTVRFLGGVGGDAQSSRGAGSGSHASSSGTAAKSADYHAPDHGGFSDDDIPF